MAERTDTHVSPATQQSIDEILETVWRPPCVDEDCAVYYCPQSECDECLTHGGFDICCTDVEYHQPARSWPTELKLWKALDRMTELARTT